VYLSVLTTVTDELVIAVTLPRWMSSVS